MVQEKVVTYEIDRLLLRTNIWEYRGVQDGGKQQQDRRDLDICACTRITTHEIDLDASIHLISAEVK